MISILRRREKVVHRHFYYTSLFNNVYVEEKMHTCSLEEQRQLYNEQLKKADMKKATTKEGTKVLLHFSKEYCIYSTITPELKNSSDATAGRAFIIVHEYSQQELLEDQSNKTYLKEDEIMQIFDKHFMSKVAYDSLIHEMSKCVTELEMTMKSDDSKDTRILILMRNLILRKEEEILQVQLNYELPYNEWLYKLVKEKLDPLGFVVHLKDQNCPKAPASSKLLPPLQKTMLPLSFSSALLPFP